MLRVLNSRKRPIFHCVRKQFPNGARTSLTFHYFIGTCFHLPVSLFLVSPVVSVLSLPFLISWISFQTSFPFLLFFRSSAIVCARLAVLLFHVVVFFFCDIIDHVALYFCCFLHFSNLVNRYSYLCLRFIGWLSQISEIVSDAFSVMAISKHVFFFQVVIIIFKWILFVSHISFLIYYAHVIPSLVDSL